MDFETILAQSKPFPIYHKAYQKKSFDILNKTDISSQFPDGWLSEKVKEDLKTGQAEYVTTTGTNYDRMTLIRPPFFLMNQYFKIWSTHPELKKSWDQGCMRISLTTIRATQHVTKSKDPSVKERTFGQRALYLNKKEDPYDWGESDIKRMIKEIKDHGSYHLDGDPFYIAYLIRKAKEFNLWQTFPKPETVIHAYEFCTKNVSSYLRKELGCPVINLFGSTELGFLFSTSFGQGFQSYFEDLKLELHPVSQEANIFSLIVTSFRNPYMPLIRYRSGDCVETFNASQSPDQIIRICGREREILTFEDKRCFSHAQVDDIIHKHAKSIFLYQLHKYAKKIVLDYTTFEGNSLDLKSVNHLKEDLQDSFNISCQLNFVKNISPKGSGKYAWLKVCESGL